MARVPFNTTIEAATKEAIDALSESEGTTYGRLVDSMVVFYRDRAKLDISAVTSRLDLLVGVVNQHLVDPVGEILELCRSMPDSAGSGGEQPLTGNRFVDSAASLERALPAGVQVGTTGLLKNATCGHCGNRFAGRRGATICRACEDGSHRGDPRDCGVCGELRGGL